MSYAHNYLLLKVVNSTGRSTKGGTYLGGGVLGTWTRELNP